MLIKRLHKIYLLAALFTAALNCQARQLHTVADGYWADTAVWFNHVTPIATSDTIQINNHITLSGYLAIGQNEVLTINTGASLCGPDTFEIYDNAQVYINGYLGASVISAPQLLSGPGYNYYIFIGGEATIATANWNVNEIGAQVELVSDTLGGCLVTTYTGDFCNQTCPYDSNIYVRYNGNIVYFEVDTSAPAWRYDYIFGDGSKTDSTTFYQSHFYADTGLYQVMVIFRPCCHFDTLYTTVHVTGFTTGQLPLGWCNTSQPIIKSPMPAADVLLLNHTFCTAMHGTVTIYSLTGTAVYSTPFATANNAFNMVIPVSQLATGCYILSLETNDGTYHTKVLLGR